MFICNKCSIGESVHLKHLLQLLIKRDLLSAYKNVNWLLHLWIKINNDMQVVCLES